ncbi:MAG: HAD-IA family hydrolase [bacterium]|nr:HAD-IA family hydrolase [bacterium]
MRLSPEIEVDAIGFDFDHTLGFDQQLELRFMLRYAAAAARRSGIAVDDDLEARAQALLMQARAGACSIDEAVAALLGQFISPEAARAESRRWRAEVVAAAPAWVRPLEGMRAGIARLEARGVPLAILTNGWSPLQEAKARAVGLAHLPILVSECIGVRKPAPGAFAALLDRLGTRAERTAYVGDDWQIDVLGARAAALPAVWVPEHAPSEEERRELPRRVLLIRSLEELAEESPERAPHRGRMMGEAPHPLAGWADELVCQRLRDFEERRIAALANPDDVEALHHVRTRARRLRAALEDLHEAYPHAGPMLRALKRLGRRTGAARDNDVLLERVERYCAAARGATREHLERMTRRLRQRRERLRKRALEAIESCLLLPGEGADT